MTFRSEGMLFAGVLGARKQMFRPISGGGYELKRIFLARCNATCSQSSLNGKHHLYKIKLDLICITSSDSWMIARTSC